MLRIFKHRLRVRLVRPRLPLAALYHPSRAARTPLPLPRQNARKPTLADCHQAWGWAGKPARLPDYPTSSEILAIRAPSSVLRSLPSYSSRFSPELQNTPTTEAAAPTLPKDAVSLALLQKAKKLASQFGSIKEAKAAIDALAQILD